MTAQQAREALREQREAKDQEVMRAVVYEIQCAVTNDREWCRVAADLSASIIMKLEKDGYQLKLVHAAGAPFNICGTDVWEVYW
jgi:hypothetical protein